MWVRIGGSLGGGCRRAGSSASNVVVAAATAAMASSKIASAPTGGFVAPLTLRTYWRAAASISSAVAGGCSPRRIVMLRHMVILPTGCRLRSHRDRHPGGVWYDAYQIERRPVRGGQHRGRRHDRCRYLLDPRRR